jgi:putative hydrolase of the HAD superfamily
MRRADEAWARSRPPRAAFLDDIGRNLKPARALGMATIKVNDPDQALRDLSALLGIELGRPH